MGEAARSACVIGWPVEHSRSPLIHNYWIKHHGLAANYRREAVPPDRFADFLRRLSEHGYVGANVTLPHKEAALALTQPDDRAEAVGAANTLWLDHGRLHSTNTDVEGFLGNLDAQAAGWEQGLDSAVVLGAGGAARAVVFGLIQRGVDRIHVANRSFERATALHARFGDAVHPARWEARNEVLAGAGLLVNTTTLGMNGQPALEIDLARLPATAVVADLVYVPLETALLVRAKERGLRTAEGLGMLLHQAVRGFSLWFGMRPEVTAELRKSLEADLRRE